MPYVQGLEAASSFLKELYVLGGSGAVGSNPTLIVNVLLSLN